MENRNRLRQQRWKKRQAEEGKKPITVMLSSRTKELIDREREEKGGTIAAVIERAIETLFGVVTSNSSWFELSPAELSPLQKEIIEEVNQRRYGTLFKTSTIAILQNKRSVPTLTGADQWDEVEVQQIFDYLDKYDLGEKLRFLKKWE